MLLCRRKGRRRRGERKQDRKDRWVGSSQIFWNVIAPCALQLILDLSIFQREACYETSRCYIDDQNASRWDIPSSQLKDSKQTGQQNRWRGKNERRQRNDRSLMDNLSIKSNTTEHITNRQWAGSRQEPTKKIIERTLQTSNISETQKWNKEMKRERNQELKDSKQLPAILVAKLRILSSSRNGFEWSNLFHFGSLSSLLSCFSSSIRVSNSCFHCFHPCFLKDRDSPEWGWG